MRGGEYFLKRARGFTLIELVMVIVILGTLSAIAIPKFVDVSTQAKVSATKASLGTIRSAISIAYAQSALTGTPTYPNPISGTLFVSDTLPMDSYFNVSTIITSTNNPISSSDFTDTGGWVYNSTTGEIRANVPGGHGW